MSPTLMVAGLLPCMLIDGEEEAASDSAVMERMAMERMAMAVTDIPTPTAITMTRTMVDATWFVGV